MAMRALAAGTIPVYSGDAEPVSDVMRPSVMVDELTPGALDFSAAPLLDPVDPVDPVAPAALVALLPAAPVVAELWELLCELPQAAAATTTPVMSAAIRHLAAIDTNLPVNG
jgi:hypothetical protein